MHRVLILGAGKIGALISGLLAESGAYRVQLADVNGEAADAVVRAHGLSQSAGSSRSTLPNPAALASAPEGAPGRCGDFEPSLLLQRGGRDRGARRPACTTST